MRAPLIALSVWMLGITPMPALPTVDVDAVLPPPLYKIGERDPLPAFTSPKAHASALKEHPLHGDAFFVEGVHGDLQSGRTVFLVPQFHRHPNMPVTWNTFGGAIIHIQRNIEALTTVLHNENGVRCFGTEGSWVDDIKVPFELRQIARWSQDLRARRAALKGRSLEVTRAAAHVDDALQRVLKRTVGIYDGVGMAEVRTAGLGHRFGLEDGALNREALALLAELQAVEQQLAKLDPQTQSAVAGAMGELWLLEIDEYETEVLTPLRKGLTALDRARTTERHAGGDDAVYALSRFVTLAKLVTERAVKLDEMDAYTAFYRELKVDVEQAPELKTLNAAQKRERARLERVKTKIQTRYDEVSLTLRDRAAVKKLSAKLGPSGSCAMVFGMAHQAGLLEELKKEKDLAVIVVAPFDREALARGELSGG